MEEENKEEVKPVKFDADLSKFQNIKTLDDVLNSINTLNNVLTAKVKYFTEDKKGNRQLVETTILNDEELLYIKNKLLGLTNYIN